MIKYICDKNDAARQNHKIVAFPADDGVIDSIRFLYLILTTVGI